MFQCATRNRGNPTSMKTKYMCRLRHSRRQLLLQRKPLLQNKHRKQQLQRKPQRRKPKNLQSRTPRKLLLKSLPKRPQRAQQMPHKGTINLCFMKFILWSTNGSWNEFSRLQSGFFFEKEKYSDTVIKRNTVFLDVSSELEGANMKIFYLYLPVLAETTITKYHTLDCLNSRNVFFHCSGDQSLRQISW